MDNFEFNKKTTLILTETDPSSDMMFNSWIAEGFNAAVIFKPHAKIVRAIRRLWVDTFLTGYYLWYGDWKNNLDDYKTIILHASERTRTIPRYIHKRYPKMRIIYWYWNPVNNASLPSLTKDNDIECWTFDKGDAKKYAMKLNVQYYYDVNNINSVSPEYDVYFVGHDKGRMNVLNEIRTLIERNNFSYRFDVVKDGDKNIPYSEIQKRIAKSKAILEINQSGQSGCTLRALEALFFRKKLITTNINIMKEDFYNSNNIFIIGKDDISNLQKFIESSYDCSSDKFRDNHTIRSWFNNFFI